MGLKLTAAGILLAAFTAVAALPAHAQETPAPASAVSSNPAQYATKLHLAYIRSSSALVNNDAQRGLESLGAALIERTTVEPAGVVGLDIEKDDLSLFPFIYWPVSQDAQPLSARAQQKVQTYINSGGVILFDLRDAAASLGNSAPLRRLLGGISVKPLVPMDKDHTLTKSYYLVSGLPGSDNIGDIWVEAAGSDNAEHVSSIIIGDNNWAGAWAGRTLPRDSEDREMAIRAGINLVMYALSGNYKSDAIHTSAVLEKLERKPGIGRTP